MKEFGAILLCLIGGLAMVWVLQGNDFFLYKFFAPKYESVRRETFEQSKAYNEGVAQELRSAQLSYTKADSQQKKQAIASFVLHTVAGYDTSNLPPDLAGFVHELQGELR